MPVRKLPNCKLPIRDVPRTSLPEPGLAGIAPDGERFEKTVEGFAGREAFE